MIVKVQIAIAGKRQVLVYNEDNSICYQWPVTPEVERVMGDFKKLFFKAHIDGTEIMLDEIIEDQGW